MTAGTDPLPVRARGLARRFGRRVALDGIDLDVGGGAIVGLVGANGSGKTTLLRILAGFLRPDRGEARVFGLDPWRDAPRVARRARFVFAPPALFEPLSAWEHLVHLTRIGASGARGARRPARAELERALRDVGLWERRHDRVRVYSFGMRQRLALALALVPRPELVVLDEPTDGLDPLAVRELRDVLARLRREHGTSILLSSHLVIEIERLVDTVLVLAEGRPLFQGPPGELVGSAGRIELETDDARAAARLLRARGLDAAAVDGSAVELPLGALDLEGARAALAAGGLALRSFCERRPSLEEALLARLRAERVPERREGA